MRPSLTKAQRREWNALRDTIGRNLHYYRRLRRMSLTACARRIAISPDILDDYEMGKRSITVLHLLRLAYVLDAPFEQLLKRTNREIHDAA